MGVSVLFNICTTKLQDVDCGGVGVDLFKGCLN